VPLLRADCSGEGQGEECPKTKKMNKHLESFLLNFPHTSSVGVEDERLVFRYQYKTVLEGSKELAERIVRTRKLPLVVNTVTKVGIRSHPNTPMELIITYKPELDDELKIAAIRDRQDGIQKVRERESRT
jgi:hypothetical protein